MEEEPSDETRVAEVELVYFDGCPHWCDVHAHLEAALAQVGRSDSVELQLVTNEAEAQQHHMVGLPTILIGGRDPFPSNGPTWGCRLYPGVAESEGAPSVKIMVELLS